MFDFAFSEVLVICVVALVVLGPTRLPGVVRKVGRWIGKARGMARDFRQQLENEVTLDELNRMTEKQSRPPPPAPSAGPAEPGTPEPAEAPSPMADAGYPYGASPEAGQPPDGTPAPTDDTYSHAHAADAPPAPWSPEAGHAAEAPAGETPDEPDRAAGADKANA